MAETYTKAAVRFLDNLRRPDLAALLSQADIEVGVYNDKIPDHRPRTGAVCRGLSAAPPYDAKRIVEGAVTVHSGREAHDNIVVKVKGEPVTGIDALLPELLIHREMMIEVSTGRQELKEVEDYYGARQARIVEVCADLAIRYENPHEGLWDWYRYWKENFAHYAERRDYVRKLFSKPIAMAAGRITNPSPVQERAPTGWNRVDRCLSRARARFDAAAVEEDWQAVGLLCREA